MANRYWVGGAGNWSSTTKWSTSSGGASGASVPTSADDAIFDANSGGKFVATVDTAQQVNSLTITPSAGAGVLEIAISVSLTTGNLTTTGTAGNNRIWFRSATYGISTNLIVNGTVSISDCDFRGLYVTGTSAPISGTRIGNRGECRNITFSTPKTVYWNLAGAQNWDANGWTDTSTGTPSTDFFPLPQDTATFTNAGSVTGAISLGTTAPYLPTVDMSGRTTAMTLNFNAGKTVYGNWKNGSGTAFSVNTGTLTFSGGGTQTITSAGKTFPGPITVDTYGGSVELVDPLNIGSNALTVTNGTFNTAGFSVTAGSLSSSNSNVRTISLGASTVTLSSSLGVDLTTITNLTFNCETSTINLNSGGSFSTLNSGGLVFYDVSFGAIGSVTYTFTGQNTFRNLTIAAPSTAGVVILPIPANQTITGTLTCAGASAVRRIFLQSNTIGTQRTITAAAISANNCDFRDINLAGAASGASPTRAGDCGGNSGITFPAPKTVYWNLAGAQNWSATAWAPGSGGTPDINNFPLAQDTAVFDNTGSVTGTITVDRPWNIGTFDASLRTSAMTLSTGINQPVVYGDWKFGTGVTSSSTAGTITFSSPTTETITSNGVQFGCNVTVNHPSGTVQLADALSLGATRTLTLTAGTFDAVTYNVTTGAFSNGAATNTLKMGSGTWTLSGTGTVWTGSGTTIVGTSTIVLSDTSTSSRSFNGGNLYYNKLTIGGTTGTSTLTITGANTFGELASTKTVAHTITFQTVLTAFIGKWSVTGTIGNVVTVNSSAAGTAFNISIIGPANSGIDYLSVRDCTVATTSPGEFYVGANSTNVSNNTRVIFTATPAPRTLYWRGGTGNWSATTSWDTVSGGAGPAAIPTSLDAVVFNSASNATAYTATIDAGVTLARCASFTMAGPLLGNVTFAGTVGIAFHGSVSFAATGITNSYTGDMQLAGNASYTFTTNSLVLASTTTQSGVGSTWTLGAGGINLGSSRLIVNYGSFSTSASNYSITAGGITLDGSTGTRSLSLNGSTVTCSALGTNTTLAFSNSTNLTFNAGTSQITLANSTAGISSSGVTFNNVSFTSATAASITITGANTFNTLSFAGRTTVGINTVTFSANQTITTLTLNAGTAAAYRTFLASNTIGTQRTLTVTTLTAGAADYDFRDIAIAGGAAPIAPTRAGDCKGNSGITFPAAKTVYYRQTGSANWGATGTGSWSATSGGGFDATQFPLAQDTAVFPAATYPASGSTTTVNANYNIGTIDMNLRTANTMTLATGTNTPAIYGNWINGTGTTLTGTGNMTFAGRGSQTITSAGKTFTQTMTFAMEGGSVTLQDSFVCTGGQVTFSRGTFDANSYNVTINGGAVSSSNNNTRTIAIGSGTWTVTVSGPAWTTATTGSFSVTGTGTISLTSASSKTFAGGGANYSGITLDQGGAGTLTISGNNTFKDITNTYSATGATTISLTTTTQTVTNFTGTGASGKVLTLSGTSAASSATLVITGSVGVGTDYINVNNVRGYPLADSWKIGVNSTNAGSLGFIFVATSGNIYNSSVSETSTVADSIAGGFLFLANVQELLTIIDQTFAAASFSTAASETSQAADTTSVAASNFGAINLETATALDAQSAAASFRGSASESATASETTTVAASTFGATSAETATAQDSVDAPGSIYNPSAAETVQIADTPSAAATFPVATSETATIADQNAAAFTAATNISESATAADTTAALVAFAALAAENASASDQTLVVPSTFNAIAAAAAQAFDSVNAPGSIYNAPVSETAVALDSIIGAFLWNLIDDDQTTAWVLINDNQSSGWQNVNDDQAPNWQNIP